MDNNKNILNLSVKVALIAGIIVIALSVAYYLVVYLPKQNEFKSRQVADKELQNRIDKCYEDAKKFHADYIKTVSGSYLEPEYHYNKKVKKCLYSGGSMEGKLDFDNSDNGSTWNREIRDVYTNEIVLSVWKGAGTDAITNYWNNKDKLFSE